MITNSDVTIYHKIFDTEERKEKWERLNFKDVWVFGGKGASINKGYDNANNVDVRIDYNTHEIDDEKIKIGDIIVPENLDLDIQRQTDLKNYTIYNITSITNNKFGMIPHIHLGGK